MDGLELLCNGIISGIWLSSPYLQFKNWQDSITKNTIDNKLYASYKGLRFSMTKSRVDENLIYHNIRGSFPRYLNNGEDNAYDYTFQDFIRTIEDLNRKFGIKVENTFLKGFEFGVNITLPFPVKDFFNHLIIFNRKEFLKLGNIGYECNFQRYSIKIYDKGKQQGMKNSFIRIELKVKKMEHVRPYGIHTLSDLCKLEAWKKLSDLLLSYWDGCLYINQDDFNTKKISTLEKQRLLEYVNPRYWNNCDKYQVNRARKYYDAICEKFQVTDEKQIVTNLIKEKLQKIQMRDVNLLTNSMDKKSIFDIPRNQVSLFNHYDEGFKSIEIKTRIIHKQ